MLTFDQIYDKDSVLNMVVKIELKRKKTDGTYESAWSDIKDLVSYPIIASDSIKNMSMKFPNDGYNFGLVRVPDCTLKLISTHQEFADELAVNSIWYKDFIRHETLVKISHGYKDIDSGDAPMNEVYRGFINDKSAKTHIDKDNLSQNLQIEDVLSYLMKKYTFSDISPTATVLSSLVFEVFNRSEFTDFLTVDIGNISTGFEFTNISYTTDSDPTWEGQTQILTFLEGLSVGHSYFYQKEGVFYYESIEHTGSIKRSFGTDRVVKFMNYERGIDKAYDSVFWSDTDLSWEATEKRFNRNLTFDVKGVLTTSIRQAFLNYIGPRLNVEKAGFKLDVPLYSNFSLGDKILVVAGNYIVNKPFILGQSILGQDYLRAYTGASHVDTSETWTIIDFKHNFKSCVTNLALKESI